MMTTGENGRPRLGFIGLGHMGSHMVVRLMDAGYHLTIFDRTKERAQEFAQRGASVAARPRDLADSCDVILSCVTDDAALESVIFGSDGMLAGVRAGNVLIDLSTVAPKTSRSYYEAAKQKGIAMIDAAVSGSVPQVEQGKLVIFVGGEEATFQQCKPILDVLGQTSFYMGASGMGTAMKLVVNTLLGLGLQALAEAIALGEKSGIEKELLLNVLNQTAVISPSHKTKLENARKDEYPINFALSLMYKDFGLILDQAAELTVPMPATAAAQQMYAAARILEKEEDFAVVIRFMERLAGLSSLHNE